MLAASCAQRPGQKTAGCLRVGDNVALKATHNHPAAHSTDITNHARVGEHPNDTGDYSQDLLTLASKGLTTIFGDLYSAAKSALREKVNERLSLRRASNIADNIAQIGKVKTIFNPDTIVDLHDIYFSGAIAFENAKLVDENVTLAERICSIDRTKLLIEGGPGQGKSLYLKTPLPHRGHKRQPYTDIYRIQKPGVR